MLLLCELSSGHKSCVSLGREVDLHFVWFADVKARPFRTHRSDDIKAVLAASKFDKRVDVALI